MKITITTLRTKLFLKLLKYLLQVEKNKLRAIYYACSSGRYYFNSLNKF